MKNIACVRFVKKKREDNFDLIEKCSYKCFDFYLFIIVKQEVYI